LPNNIDQQIDKETGEIYSKHYQILIWESLRSVEFYLEFKFNISATDDITQSAGVALYMSTEM